MSKTKIYLDLMSQPSRNVWLFCKITSLPVELVMIRIGKGENRTPAMLAINPVGKLPFLQDGENFRLVESGAILNYLAIKYQSLAGDDWYPTLRPALKARAVVDSIMDWQLTNIRPGAAGFLFQLVRLPLVTGKPVDKALAAQAENTLRAGLKSLEAIWLAPAAGGTGGPLLCPWQKGEPLFLGGLTHCSVADIQVASELEQLAVLTKLRHGVDMEELLAPHPAVRAWLARVAAACGPHYDEAYAQLRKIAAAAKAWRPDSKL